MGTTRTFDSIVVVDPRRGGGVDVVTPAGGVAVSTNSRAEIVEAWWEERDEEGLWDLVVVPASMIVRVTRKRTPGRTT